MDTVGTSHFEGYPSFERLELMFKRPKDPAVQPATITAITKSLDSEASVEELCHVVVSDPGLALRTIKLMGIFDYHNSVRMIDLEGAFAKHGVTAFRSFLTSTIIGGNVLSADKKVVDIQRMNLHSQFVAEVLARFARRRPEFGVKPSEALALGAIHDVGLILLSSMCPEGYLRVVDFATQCNIGLDIAFSCIYPKSIHSLAASALHAWRVEQWACDIINRYEEALGEDPTPYRCFLRIADWLSYQFGYHPEPFAATTALPPGFETELATEIEIMATEAEFLALNGLCTDVSFETTAPVDTSRKECPLEFPGAPSGQLDQAA
ncbi:MAG: HDOD domain-containing protein [Armatimonadetes bacterium]|nr:HDOD domain-containing protein [Armatimonadota bacterium]